MIEDHTFRYIKFKQVEGECSSDTVIRYQILIGIFGHFLNLHYHDEEDLILHLNVSTCNDIFNALLYYINANKIQSEETCDLFISVVKGFYRFLSSSNVITNDPLLKSFDHNNPGGCTFASQYVTFKKTL